MSGIPPKILTRAQDTSGTLKPSEVQTGINQLLGAMTMGGEIDLRAISNGDKFDEKRLLGYWESFQKLLPEKTLETVELLALQPHKFGRVTVDGETGLGVKMSWEFGLHLNEGKKLPLVLFNAFNEAGRQIGYNPFYWTFNTDKPFAEDWANEHVKQAYPKQ